MPSHCVTEVAGSARPDPRRSGVCLSSGAGDRRQHESLGVDGHWAWDVDRCVDCWGQGLFLVKLES